MKEKLKQKKGITLIALVITIIVLLILAGISIAMLTGNNGILTQAQNAKEQNTEGSEIEKIKLAYNTLATKLNIGEIEKITADNIKQEMIKNGEDENNIEVDGMEDGVNPDINIYFKDTQNEYFINGKDKEVFNLKDNIKIYTFRSGNSLIFVGVIKSLNIKKFKFTINNNGDIKEQEGTQVYTYISAKDENNNDIKLEPQYLDTNYLAYSYLNNINTDNLNISAKYSIFSDITGNCIDSETITINDLNQIPTWGSWQK